MLRKKRLEDQDPKDQKISEEFEGKLENKEATVQ